MRKHTGVRLYILYLDGGLECMCLGASQKYKLERIVIIHFSMYCCDGVCVYYCKGTHTHTLHIGYSDVSPGVETRPWHLESLKNPGGLNLGISAYKVHEYIYMLGGSITSGLTAFVLLTYRCFQRWKAKDAHVIFWLRIQTDSNCRDLTLRVIDNFV